MKLIKIKIEKNQPLKNIHNSRIKLSTLNKEKITILCTILRKQLLKEKLSLKN